jgi:hypothetical protein
MATGPVPSYPETGPGKAAAPPGRARMNRPGCACSGGAGLARLTDGAHASYKDAGYGHPAARFSATEKGSGRIRGISGCSKASSRITTGQADTSTKYVATFQLPAGTFAGPAPLS